MTTLKIGDKAPSFESVDEKGNVVKLSDYAGKKLHIVDKETENSQQKRIEHITPLHPSYQRQFSTEQKKCKHADEADYQVRSAELEGVEMPYNQSSKRMTDRPEKGDNEHEKVGRLQTSSRLSGHISR